VSGVSGECRSMTWSAHTPASSACMSMQTGFFGLRSGIIGPHHEVTRSCRRAVSFSRCIKLSSVLTWGFLECASIGAGCCAVTGNGWRSAGRPAVDPGLALSPAVTLPNSCLMSSLRTASPHFPSDPWSIPWSLLTCSLWRPTGSLPSPLGLFLFVPRLRSRSGKLLLERGSGPRQLSLIWSRELLGNGGLFFCQGTTWGEPGGTEGLRGA